MGATGGTLLVVGLVVAMLVVAVLVRGVHIVPPLRRDIVERLGRYHRTLEPGLNILIPGVDRVRAKVNTSEQVLTMSPQPVVTSDNVIVAIDTVLYYRVV